jgi:hypothetical protein
MVNIGEDFQAVYETALSIQISAIVPQPREIIFSEREYV